MLSDPAEQLLEMIRTRGFRVSVFDNPGSLWGTVKPFVEMHALDLSKDPPERKTVRVFDDDGLDIRHVATWQIALHSHRPSYEQTSTHGPLEYSGSGRGDGEQCAGNS